MATRRPRLPREGGGLTIAAMASVCIGIGSNLGDRRGYLELARRELSLLPGTRVVGFSAIHETAPVGTDATGPQGDYLNAAAVLETTLSPDELLAGLQAIEAKAGREPPGVRQRWGPRTLDLDILLYDDRIIARRDLVVPHPRMHERDFVLGPLAEIAPDHVHPLLRRSVRALLKELGALPPAP